MDGDLLLWYFSKLNQFASIRLINHFRYAKLIPWKFIRTLSSTTQRIYSPVPLHMCTNQHIHTKHTMPAIEHDVRGVSFSKGHIGHVLGTLLCVTRHWLVSHQSWSPSPIPLVSYNMPATWIHSLCVHL